MSEGDIHGEDFWFVLKALFVANPEVFWTAVEAIVTVVGIEVQDVCRKVDEVAGLIPHLPKRTALRMWGVPFAQV